VASPNEFELNVAEANPISGVQQRRLADPNAIDEQAAARPDVLDHQRLTGSSQDRVSTTDIRILESNIVALGATDAQLGLRQRESLAAEILGRSDHQCLA
jgi:hypothetical protein